MSVDSKEFLEVLAKIPCWQLLMPSHTDVWRYGDEYRETHRWHEISDGREGRPITTDNVVRRPIPEPVLRSMAWWALYNQLAEYSSTGAYFEYEEHDKSWPLSTCLDLKVTGLRKFGSRAHLKSLIPILGGESEIIKNLQEGPGAYMRWVLG